MHASTRRLLSLLALLVSLSLVAAACGGDGEGGATSAGDGTETGGGAAGGGIEGQVVISGSSTVEPISIAVAEMFEDVEPGVAVDVDGPGTGDGFELFCNGEIDIADASRPIKDEEIQACENNGVELIEIKVAIDGLSVLTSPANDGVDCLTFADLYALVGPESEGFDTWADARALAEELGSTTELPDAPLDITAPGEESGTYDSFIEIALADVAEERVAAGEIGEDEAGTTRPDYQSSPDDTTIIQGIEGSDSSFGWVGFAFAEEAGDGVKPVQIDGGEGCVEPTPETIADGTYPIARPLFIYVSAAAAEESPAVTAYVDHYLGEGIAAVEEVGYVALPDDQLQESIDAWEARETGTRES